MSHDTICRFIKSMTGKSTTFDVERNDAIQTVKEKYSDESGYPTKNIGLMFAGKYLENQSTLSDYNIQEESIIYFVFPPDIISMRQYSKKPSISPSMINWNVHSDPIISQFKAVYSDQDYELVILWMYRQCDVSRNNLPTDLAKMLLLYLQFVPKEIDANGLNQVSKRIKAEIMRLERDSSPGIVIRVHPENYRHFLIEIEGPKDSPYEGGIFYVEMFLGKQYAMTPPKCLFITPIIHPCIFPDGRFYMDMLKSGWTPALGITRVAMLIQVMLQDMESYSWKAGDSDFDIKTEAKKATLKYATT